MPLRNKKNSEKGQILLIVVLAAVISLTVGLSAVSRTITNTRVSTEEANSQKALSAAEAGIEEQINKARIDEGTDKPLSNNSGFKASAIPVNGLSFPVNNGEPLKQDEGADVWLSNYPDFTGATSPNLSIFWKDSGSSSCSNDPAIEVAVISGNRTTPSMTRFVMDGCTSRRGSNHFEPPDSLGSVPAALSQFNFNRRKNLGVINTGYIARVIPLYANASVGVLSTNGESLPSQGYVISSTGTSGSTVRKVKVYQGFPALPVEFFPYNLFLP